MPCPADKLFKQDVVSCRDLSGCETLTVHAMNMKFNVLVRQEAITAKCREAAHLGVREDDAWHRLIAGQFLGYGGFTEVSSPLTRSHHVHQPCSCP